MVLGEGEDWRYQTANKQDYRTYSLRHLMGTDKFYPYTMRKMRLFNSDEMVLIMQRCYQADDAVNAYDLGSICLFLIV